MYRVVDPGARRGQYEYFRTFSNPYVGLTVNCDITALRGVKPFFLTLLYCTVHAANAVPELRRRIKGEQLVEYDICSSSHTVALPDETYCYCRLDCSMPYAEFIPYAMQQVEAAKANPSLRDEGDVDRLYFISSVPWVSFVSVSLPLPEPPDSIPRITFGKAFAQDGKYLLPVNLTANHALVDGVHMAKFFQKLEENFRSIP